MHLRARRRIFSKSAPKLKRIDPLPELVKNKAYN